MYVLKYCFVTGILGILWFLGWAYLVAESPEEHRTISTEELKYIQDSIGFTQKQARVEEFMHLDNYIYLC